MKGKNQKNLNQTLLLLEQLASKILQTQGYNGEAEKIVMLKELIKEQERGEDASNSTRKAR